MICSRVVIGAAAVASSGSPRNPLIAWGDSVIRMYHTDFREPAGPEQRLAALSGLASTAVPLTIEQAFPNRLCGVLRHRDADAGFQACLAALEGGVGSIEITTTVPSCFEMIRGLRASTGAG